MPHAKHTTVTDYDAIDQLRARHLGLKATLAAVRIRLKGSRPDKVNEAIDMITKALNDDKKIDQ